ncbi:MAG: autotransporter outer membrane beta-barrel domain-containing protein [Opitutaceae bacterium]|jgi:outer membrane autotransporter protein|nr:autotransporter outer membrane beta-barrel domain-containing protein [Opitutaceae bacterium]
MTTTPRSPGGAPRRSIAVLSAALAFALAVFVPDFALAAPIYWGGGTGTLTENTNWFSDEDLTTSVTPTHTIDTHFITAGTITITGATTVRDTNIGHGAGDYSVVNVSAAWNNTTGELAVGEGAGATGVLNILAGGTVRANTFYVGEHGTGTLYIAQGGTLGNAANSWVGRNPGSTGNTATIDGVWNTGGYFRFAENGVATMTIGASGTLTSASYLRVGGQINTSGTIIVHGYLETATYLQLGRAGGDGYLEILSGGIVKIGSYAHIGSSVAADGTRSSGTTLVKGLLDIGTNLSIGEDDANGTVIVENGGRVIVGNLAYIGGNASPATPGSSGTLILNPGAFFSATSPSGGIYLGQDADTRGEIVVSASAHLHTAGIISVGHLRASAGSVAPLGGRGLLRIAAGGTVTTDSTGENALGNRGLGSGATLDNATGTAFVDGVWLNAGELSVGRSGDGFLQVGVTGTVQNSNAYIGRYFNSGSDAGRATGTAFVDGAWLSTGTLIVGDAGVGYLEIAAGGTVTAGRDLYIGNGSVATGTAIVAGHLANTGTFLIGHAGSGHLEITAGGTVDNTTTRVTLGGTAGGYGVATVGGYWRAGTDQLSIGAAAGGTGALTIQTGGTVTAGTLYVGNYGSGTLLVAPDAVLLNTANGHLARNGSGSGAATIAGLWQNGGDLVVGYLGNGLLTIESTGTVGNVVGYLAYNPGVTGTAIVHGLWDNSSYFHLGRRGSGEVIVGPSGTVKVGSYTNIGNQVETAYGRAAVAGLWETGGYLNLGVTGTGILDIAASGTVTVGDIFIIGNTPTGRGAATVHGLLTAASSIEIGRSGAGLLDIAAGGAVLNTSGTLGVAAGATGTAIIAGFWQNNGSLANGLAGAGAIVIAPTGTVAIAGDYAQNAASALTITLDAARTTPYLAIAGGATLDGTLNITGAAAGGAAAKASELAGAATLIRAVTGTLAGDFAVKNISISGDSGADYLVIGNAAKSADAKTYDITLGLAWNATAAAAAGAFTIASGEAFEVDVPLADRAAADIAGSAWDGKSLVKLGPGALTLSAANSYTGDTTVGDGLLAVAGGDFRLSAATLTIAGSGSASVDGVYSQDEQGTLDLTLGGPGAKLTVGGGTLGGTLNVTGASSDAGGANASDLVGSGITIIRATSGTLAGDFLAKNISISAGAGQPDYLLFDAFKSADAKTYDITLGLAWNATTAAASGTFTLAPGEAFNIDIPLTDTAAGVSSLTKAGDGTLTLSAANSYTGDTIIAGGVLTIAGGGRINSAGALRLDPATGATLAIAGDGAATIGGMYSQNEHGVLTMTLAGGTDAKLTVGGATLGGTLNVTGDVGGIAAAKASELTGAATLIRATSGTIAGDFATKNVIVGGTSGADYLVIGSAAKSADAKTYDITLGLAWNATAAAASGTFTLADGVEFDVDTPLANTPAVTALDKAGPGTLVLSAANTYTGPTSIHAGILRLATPGALAASSGVTIAPGATLNLGGHDQTLAALTNHGLVDFVNLNRTLTLAGALAGSGTFRMDVDIAAGAADRLDIQGAATGAHTLLLANTGADPAGTEAPLLVVSTQGGAATFTGTLTAGFFDYEVQNGATFGLDATDWYVAAIADASTVNALGVVLNSGLVAQQNLWFAQLSSLTNHLADARHAAGTDSSAVGAGLWLRAHGAQYNVSGKVAGRRHRQLIHGADAGADKIWRPAPGDTIVTGLFAGHGVNDIRFRDGGDASGDVTSNHGGLYASWLRDNGLHVDLVLKFANLDTRLAGSDSSADYRGDAAGASFEIGKKRALPGDAGWFLEQMAQAAFTRVFSKNHTTRAIAPGATPLAVETSDMDAWQIRAAYILGRSLTTSAGGQLQPYAKLGAAWLNASGGLIRSGSVTLRPDMDDTRLEIGAGLAWRISENHRLNLDYEAGFALSCRTPWSLSAGYGFRF